MTGLPPIRLARVNLILMGIIPLLVSFAFADLIRWGIDVRKTVEPFRPDLTGLDLPAPAIPSLEFPPGLFQSAAPESETNHAPVAVKETQWKLLGVSLAEKKRALLQENESQKLIWVNEGEQVGSCQVKEIREHSVLLETKQGTYEIRM